MELNKERRLEHSTSVRSGVLSRVINGPLRRHIGGNIMCREREDDVLDPSAKVLGLAKTLHQRPHMRLGVVGGLRWPETEHNTKSRYGEPISEEMLKQHQPLGGLYNRGGGGSKTTAEPAKWMRGGASSQESYRGLKIFV